MDAIMNNFMETLIPAVGTILAALLSYGVVVVVAYIKKLQTKTLTEIEKINSDNEREYAKNILSDVTDALTTAAKSLEESLVPVLKSATADGKLTKEDQELVFNSAKELAAKLMGPDTQKLLGEVVDDTETYINAKLQEILNDMKASGNNISISNKVECLEDKSSESDPLNS